MGKYEEALPYLERIDYINYLYESGNEIRCLLPGVLQQKRLVEFTKNQLESWD